MIKSRDKGLFTWYGGPQVGEITRLLLYINHVYTISGVTRLGGLPRLGYPFSRGRILPCKRLKVGNPPSWGRVSTDNTSGPLGLLLESSWVEERVSIRLLQT